MPVEQFDTNFGHLSPTEFVVTLDTFADLLLGHSFFKDNWPSYLTHPLQLKEQLKGYDESANAAIVDGGRKNLLERDERRKGAHKSAILMSQYVVMRSVSENDPSLLNSVGLKLKKRSKRSHNSDRTTILVAPIDINVKHGPDSGTVLISCSKVVGAGTYEVFLCDGDPTVDGSWRSGGHFNICRNIKLSGLVPTKQMYFKIRCHGTGTPGPFSEYVSLIIL